MTLSAEAIALIQKTAIKSEQIQEYKTGHRKKTLVLPDLSKIEITEEQQEIRNELLTIDDAVRIFAKNPDSTAWVSPHRITVLHDDAERFGLSYVDVKKTRCADLLITADEYENWMAPDEFEKIAILRFGAPETFIERLRTLQWNNEQKEKEEISNLSKSASIELISKVLDKTGAEYKDVFLEVRTSMFDLPCKTKEISVMVQIIANAKRKQICFAPEPGVMQENIREATRELYEMFLSRITIKEQERVFLGEPKRANPHGDDVPF